MNKVYNESISFAIKNLKDILFSPYYRETLEYNLEKMLKTNKEFYRYHKLTNKDGDMIKKAINIYDGKSQVDNVIDIQELEKFFHKKIRIVINLGPDNFFSKSSSVLIYALLYRYYNQYEINDAYTYTALLPVPPDDRFIVVLTYDEDNIYKVQTFVSPNQYDTDAPVYLITLPVKL